MAALIASRVSIASFALAGLALTLTPMALRAQSRASEPPVIVQVIVQQPAVIQQPVVVTQTVAASTSADPNLVRVRWGTSWYPATRLRTVWGPYTLIRFDGYGPEWDSIVHERDLRARDESSLPAWQSTVATVAMPDDHVIHRGESLMGEWHGSWYPVRVLRVRAAGARIRYDGYGSEWDEEMTRSRLRLRDPEVDGPVPQLPPQSEWQTVDAQSALRAGQRVVVRQGGAQKWATITSADGPVLWVHYRGTSTAFDEPITVDRIDGITR